MVKILLTEMTNGMFSFVLHLSLKTSYENIVAEHFSLHHEIFTVEYTIKNFFDT